VKALWVALVFAILLLSIPFDLTRSELPFYRFWGVDFQNLHAFHDCVLRDHPYDDPHAAQICHDAVDRPMRYPPLLYWSFIWTRWFSFPTALHIWTLFILIGTFVGVTCFLSPASLGQRKVLLFIGLLFAQLPALYALERGNNDVWIVLLWGLAYLAFSRGRIATSGAIAGLAAVANVYPAFAAFVIVIALLQDRRTLLRFLTGACVTGAAVSLLFFRSTLTYVGVLRTFAAEMPLPSLTSHGLPAFFSPVGVAFFAGCLLFFWAAAGWRVWRAGQHDLLFSGGLAIATFFSTTSNDYNLITVYPLMAVLFVRSLQPRTVMMRLALVSLLLTVTGSREWWVTLIHHHVAAEILALLIAAYAAMRVQVTEPTTSR
jgi:hypothetical protein